jgi:riboflavin kinase/FMN adenylyltransferase
LGREYALSGVVVQGRRLGRQLGFHTANILPPPGKVMPATGVYACRVDTCGESWPAMTNIGYKPTVDGGELSVESHLIGFEGDLYGKRITVRLVGRIREEIRFTDVGQLARQLAQDKIAALDMLSR